MRNKRRMPEVKPPQDQPLDDLAYDLLGEMILERDTKRLLEELEQEKQSGDTAEMEAFYKRMNSRCLEQIHTYFRKKKIKRFFTKTLPKFGQVAAVFIATVFVAGTVAFATSKTVRVEVMRLLVSITDEYTALKLMKDEGASFDVPADWQGTSYPSFIPEVMEVSSVDSHPNNSFVTYRDIEFGENTLNFYEMADSTEVNIDTEDTTIRPIIIQGHSGFYAEKNDRAHVYWSDGQKTFILTTQDMGKETTIKIAEGVKRCR